MSVKPGPLSKNVLSTLSANRRRDRRWIAYGRRERGTPTLLVFIKV